MNRIDKEFHAKLVMIAYEHLKASSIAVLGCALILTVLLFNSVDNQLLLLWFGLVSIISSIRFISAKNYKKKVKEGSKENFEQRFYIGLILSNLLWTIFPFLFFIPQDYILQAAVLIVYSGLSAGAMSALSPLPKALYLYMLMILVPLIIVLFMQQTPMYLGMGLLILLYMFVLMVIGRRFNENYADILEARLMYEEEKEKSYATHKRFETIFKSAPAGIFFYDKDLVIHEVNQKFADFLDAPEDFLVGLDLHTIPDQAIIPALQAPFDNRNGLYDGPYTTKYVGKDVYIKLQTSPLRDSFGSIIGAIGMTTDMTEMMSAQKQIEHQAKYDVLTDIPNRLTLKERIDRELVRYGRHKIIFAVMFLDLDHFKHINDSLGHAIGDMLLVEVAKKLQSLIRTEDMVARIGGDEFVILLPDLSKNEQEAAHKAEVIAKKIYTLFEEPLDVHGYQLSVSTSIGIALVFEEDHTADDLLKHADLAMYQAKKAGRSTSRFYQYKMDLVVKRRLDLENGLRSALSNNELDVYYQPIIDTKTGNVIAFEALLRWNSKEFGAVSPVEFIPIAEESGLILHISEFVLHKAFSQFVYWKNEFSYAESLEKIAVNISVREFNEPHFLQHLKAAMDEYGIDPHHIELEIVESIFIEDIQQAKEKMQKLQELGIGISIDDFGTGYSSLSYLKQLPFTTLKIDHSFVQDIDVDQDDRELIEIILNIAKKYNLNVVAEGVEKVEHYQFLEEKGCDYIQGYYISRPVPEAEVPQLLQEKNQLIK